MYFYIILLAALGTVAYVVIKIRHHKLETADAIFWFFFSLFLLVLAVFPQVSDSLSDFFGFQSPINLILVAVIALLLYHQLGASVDLARLRSQIAQLSEHIALFEGSEQESAQKNATHKDA